jgi:hypothetical protein
MQSGLEHCLIWYMFMNVLEEQNRSVFTNVQKMEAVCPDWNLGTHQSDHTVPELWRLQFWILIFCIFCALCLYHKETEQMY